MTVTEAPCPTGPPGAVRQGAGFCPVRGAGRMVRLFTLLELMVALAIFVLLVGVLVAFSREVTKSWGRLHREQQRFSGLMVLDRTLDGILSNAVPFSWKDEDGNTVPVFVGEPGRLQIATVHALQDLADGALRFVELSLQDGQLTALYQQRPFVDPGVDAEGAGVSVLAVGVDSLSFRYADWVGEDGLQWFDEWDPERKALPLAITVTVRWTDGRVEAWVRRTAGNGFRERWGKWQPKAIGER